MRVIPKEPQESHSRLRPGAGSHLPYPQENLGHQRGLPGRESDPLTGIKYCRRLQPAPETYHLSQYLMLAEGSQLTSLRMTFPVTCRAFRALLSVHLSILQRTIQTTDTPVLTLSLSLTPVLCPHGGGRQNRDGPPPSSGPVREQHPGIVFGWGSKESELPGGVLIRGAAFRCPCTRWPPRHQPEHTQAPSRLRAAPWARMGRNRAVWEGARPLPPQ